MQLEAGECSLFGNYLATGLSNVALQIHDRGFDSTVGHILILEV